MSNYSIRTLQTRGTAHPLRTEDDIFTYEDENYIICAVFDGCSSGKRSDIASYTHKTFLQQIVNTNIESGNFSLPWGFNKSLLAEIYCHLIMGNCYEVGKEMLSTIVLLSVNKNTKEYEITVCGDGVISVDGHSTCVHSENDDSVWYLSTVGDKNRKDIIKSLDDFYDYYSRYCKKISGVFDINIAISTDGIDTFKTPHGMITNSEEARSVFFGDNRFSDKEGMLMRLYNLYTKGVGFEDGSGNPRPVMNQDDFTMIKVIINN